MPLSSNSVPCIVLEEHHEAFYAWNYAHKQGWISATGNTLLHVDSHSDMSLPRLRTSLHSIGELDDLAEFTYRELDIGNFIWPAIYQGIFSQVFWLKYQHGTAAGSRRSMAVFGKDNTGTEFIAASLDKRSGCLPEDVRWVDYAPLTTRDPLPNLDGALVLDVDLDYFCCNEFPVLPVREIETTGAAFHEFHENPYHFLRISPGAKVSAVERNGRYFFVYGDHSRFKTHFTESAIEERIDDFMQFLLRHRVAPRMIAHCRSVHSGYTPQEHWELVEDRLISEFQRHYNAKVFSINDILCCKSLAGVER